MHRADNTTMDANSAKPYSTKRFIRRSIAIGSWLVLACVLSAWILLQFGDDWWLGTLVMFLPRWPWVVLPIFSIVSSAALRRRSLLPALISLVVGLGPVAGVCIPWRLQFQEPSAGIGLRVLTCNMHWAKTEPARLDALIRQAAPDLVVLQEWRPTSPSSVLTEDAWFVEDAPGLFLASRHPIERIERIGDDSMGLHGSAMRYELDTPAGIATVISLHLASPREGLGQLADKRAFTREGLETNRRRRSEQSAYIAEEANRVNGPVVVLGDFNTPPESVLFENAWKGYTDAFGEAGFGWGYTFVNRLTRVRIDHVLVGASGHASRCWVAPDVGSPHRPVIADVFWPAANATNGSAGNP
jgi:vancomycin resistance protein VanJ